MNKLIQQTLDWFYERGLENADPTKQVLKLLEELGELAEGMVKDQPGLVIDALGDIQVVLIGLHLQLGYEPHETLQVALNEIKDRKGQVVNGIFVKESDIE